MPLLSLNSLGLVALCTLAASAFASPLEAEVNARSAVTAVSSELSKRVISGRYIFTTTTAASNSSLYVYTSDDATNFSLWKAAAYTPPTGFIKDPSLTLHTDGKYYVAYTTGLSGSNFAIVRSDTLLSDWYPVATISTSSLFTPINTRAPEFFKDPQTGKLNIIVSLSTGSNGPFLPYAFTATDSTLTNWSGPVVLSGVSNAGQYIDTFPVFFNNQYHIFAKAETAGHNYIEHAVASTLTGPYTFAQTGDFAGWGQAQGPSVTIHPDSTPTNKKFRLYAVSVTSGKYIYSDSIDLHTWSAYKEVSNLSGTVQQGTVLMQY